MISIQRFILFLYFFFLFLCSFAYYFKNKKSKHQNNLQTILKDIKDKTQYLKV